MATFTAAQKATLKSFILGDGTLSVKAQQGDYDFVANALNAVQDYWVWMTNATKAQIYKATVAASDSSTGVATTWDWQGLKNQSVPEQNTWFEMFTMDGDGGGRNCDFGNQNNRSGVVVIFGTTGVGGANRTHIFNSVRRKVSLIEKVFATAVTNPAANTGNNSSDARGLKTNPDVLGFEGQIGATDIGGVIS